MKILYGVVGEGMGHAIRSSVILEKLLADGHAIHIVASGRAYELLERQFPQVRRIWGLTMVMADNEVKTLGTAAGNIRGALAGWPQNVRQYFEVMAEFAPDVVISDFESWTWLFAKVNRIPLICIDNIQIINRCRHERDIIAGDAQAFRLTKSIVKAKCPKARHYLVTTFFYPEIRKSRTTLVPPILRRNVLDARSTSGDHLLVYQTSDTFKNLPAMLKRLDCPVYVYGMRRDLTQDEHDGNLVYRPFSETQFIADLASCKGVVGSAGFTLIGEALHLHKPYLATPVGNQFEQTLNARYIEKLGFGLYDSHLDESSLRHFCDNLPRYRDALGSYPRQDNTLIFAKLDELLDQREALLL
ncbi:MAG: teichoic acid biosynthesis protein [Bradymonadaceae bacterium]|nr:teichoic acid biosynthesis protein [Lujinxingiaceae bacterium]